MSLRTLSVKSRVLPVGLDYHATRADLLRRLGRSEDARDAYDQAIQLAANIAEIAYLVRRRAELGASP